MRQFLNIFCLFMLIVGSQNLYARGVQLFGVVLEYCIREKKVTDENI